MYSSKRARGVKRSMSPSLSSVIILSSTSSTSFCISSTSIQYASISIIHFHKEHRHLPNQFLSFLLTPLFYPPPPSPIEDLRRKFIDDEISFCPVPIPSFLFTLFLFLDPAQRALNHPHRMDTRTRTCVRVCILKHGCMYRLHFSLTPCVYLYT